MSDAPARRQLPPLPSSIPTSLRNIDKAHIDDKYGKIRTCVTCHGRGTFRWYDQDGQVVEYDCPCYNQDNAYYRLMYCGVTPAYQRLGWNDFIDIQPEVLTVITGYLDNLPWYLDSGIGLILHGPRGSGKSMMANLLIKEMIKEGVDCYVTSFNDLIEEFTDGWKDREKSRYFDSRIRNAGVLLIDDLGREHNRGPNSVGEKILESVTRHRVNTLKPTLITTNLTQEEIAKGYGGHTIGLLMERAIFCPMVGPNRREDVAARVHFEAVNHLTRPIVFA